MNVITLYRARDLWVARHSGPVAQMLRDLFNTDELPTAYRASYDAESVRAAIAQLNPGVIVELACDCQRCGEPILRDQPAPAPAGYHLGCRPGAGRIPYPEICCFERCHRLATQKVGGEVYFPMCAEHAAGDPFDGRDDA